MRLLDLARSVATATIPSVVFVVELPNVFRPAERARSSVPWREGITPGDLLAEGWVREMTRVTVNGAALDEPWCVRLQRGDTVLLARLPGKDALSAALSFDQWVLSGQFIRDIFKGVLDVLYPTTPGRALNNSNPVYGWGQVSTQYNPAGLPVPIWYGEHRQGGSVVGQWVEIIDGDPPQSYLNTLLLVGAGPIQSIGQYVTDADNLTGSSLPDGLKIDDNSAENFDGITCSVRLGSLTQEPIPGASDVRVQYAVDLPVDQVTVASGDPPVIDWSMAATFDMPADSEADRARVGLFFPSGVYELADDGSIFNEKADLQVRYVELDGAGNPTGPYVNVFFGDDTTVSVKAKQTNPFGKQLAVAFYDPATFQQPVLSNALQFSRTNKHYGSLDGFFAQEPSWVAGGVVDAISVLGVVRIRASHPNNPWCGRYASNAGYIIDLRETAPGKSDIVFQWGNGSTLTSTGALGELLNDTPYMLAVTFQRGAAPGGLNRIRLAIDGQVVKEVLTPVGIVMPSTGFRWNVIPGSEGGSSSSFGELDHDEFRIFNRELTPDELSALHNDGDWIAGKADEPGLVMGFHMDQVLSGPLTASYIIGQAPIVLHATSGVVTAIPGFVTDTFTNTIKRSRYRVQVQRTNPVPTGLKKHSDVRFDHLITILDDELAYPGRALLFTRVLASDQLSGGPPNFTFVQKGKRDCPAWDGVNPDAPTFVSQYSNNPAWCLAQLLLDAENGGGNFFGVSDIDWPRLKEWADISEEKVYDQRGTFTASQLAYLATALGFAGAVLQVQLPKPRPLHLVLNKTFRLKDIPGGGAEYPEGIYTIGQIVDIDEDTYELWCDWPTGAAVPATNPFTDVAAAIVQGVEGRHECNLGFLDRDLKFWDAVQQICAIGRAAPMRIGDKLRIKYDGPRDPVALFTAANMVAGSFLLSAGRREDDSNSLVAEIQDRDLDWERNPVPRDHPSVQGATSTVIIRRQVIDLRGVTSRSQAIREMDFRLAIAHEIHLGCEFDAGLDAAFAEPGDVIAVAHPMPEWAAGGRVLQDSVDASSVTVDVPVVVGAKNLLGSTDTLSDVAYWARTGANPPTLFSAVEPDPAGVAQAAVFDFGAVSVLRYSRPLRSSSAYAGSVYAKVKDGLGAVNVNLNVDNGTTSLSVPDDGAWHRIQTPLTASAPDLFDIEVVSRRVALTWAQLERGTAATDYEAVGVPSAATFSAAVQDGNHDTVAFATIDAQDWGAYQAGELVLLATALPNPPLKNWLWAIGPETTATLLFQVVDTSLSMQLQRHISAVEYNPLVYADADAFPDLPGSLGAVAGNTPTVLALGAKAMPDLVGPVLVTEESHEDPDTGHLSKALAVSWRHDPATAQHVARSHVWIQRIDDAGADGAPELVASVQGRGTFFRIEGVSRRLAKGGTFRVFVQPETTAGVKRAVRRCRSATVTMATYFPVPRHAPTDARLVGAGDQVVYEVDLPSGFQGKALEFWRGGAFIGAEVGRIPVGGRTIGPTYDWVAPPVALDGRGPAPLMVRLVGPNGARGDFLRVRSAVVPAGFSDPADLAASLEDGPFDTAPAGFSEAPVLSNLQLVTPAPGSSVQRLAYSGSGFVGTYDTTVFDLGSLQRAHVGICWEGLQVAPELVDDLPSVEDPSMRSWTAEGFTDPNHPLFGQVKVELLWAFSTSSSDPGTDYQPFRPGLAYFRSCRFRLQFTRPTADWDVLVDRIAVDIRAMLGVSAGGGGGEEEHALDFGNAIDTVYVLTHDAGTRDLVCGIVRQASPYDLVDATIEATSPDTVTVTVASPPGTNALRFVWIGGVADRAAIPFGDGVSTTFNVVHELGSKNVLCAVRQAASPYAFLGTTITASSRDAVDVGVLLPPGDNALVLVAVGAALNKASVVFGDASATSYVVRHGLGSRDIVARVRDAATSNFVDATIQATDEDTVTVTLTSPPGVNGLILVATG